MVQEFKSKWVSEKYGVIVTSDKRVIRISDLQTLKREYSHNRIVYRAPGENYRIGQRSLSTSLTRCEIVLQEHCPF
jgi:hypothetical protein